MKSEIQWYIILEIKKRRKKLKMSQRYIADCLNVSRSFIRDIENPKRDSAYNVEHINDIAKVLGCSPRELWPEKPL